jgi:hypothetical protein
MSAEIDALREETDELGQTLKTMMEQDPGAQPSERAADVFAQWLAAAGPASLQPAYFADVAQNYVVRDNSCKDLFDLFMLLTDHLDLSPEPPPPAAFIGLPMAGQ